MAILENRSNRRFIVAALAAANLLVGAGFAADLIAQPDDERPCWNTDECKCQVDGTCSSQWSSLPTICHKGTDCGVQR